MHSYHTSIFFAIDQELGESLQKKKEKKKERERERSSTVAARQCKQKRNAILDVATGCKSIRMCVYERCTSTRKCYTLLAYQTKINMRSSRICVGESHE